MHGVKTVVGKVRTLNEKFPYDTVRCNTCMWEGEEEDLVLFEDEDGLGKGCPKCETDGYLIDVRGGEKLDS